MAYEDEEARLIKIRAEKGESPKDADDQPETPEEKKLLDEMEKSDNSNVNSAPAINDDEVSPNND
jgi:hypothetical protein